MHLSYKDHAIFSKEHTIRPVTVEHDVFLEASITIEMNGVNSVRWISCMRTYVISVMRPCILVITFCLIRTISMLHPSYVNDNIPPYAMCHLSNLHSYSVSQEWLDTHSLRNRPRCLQEGRIQYLATTCGFVADVTVQSLLIVSKCPLAGRHDFNPAMYRAVVLQPVDS